METELHHDRKIQNPFELFHYSTQTKATILIWLLRKLIRLGIGFEGNSSTPDIQQITCAHDKKLLILTYSDEYSSYLIVLLLLQQVM